MSILLDVIENPNLKKELEARLIQNDTECTKWEKNPIAGYSSYNAYVEAHNHGLTKREVKNTKKLLNIMQTGMFIISLIYIKIVCNIYVLKIIYRKTCRSSKLYYTTNNL